MASAATNGETAGDVNNTSSDTIDTSSAGDSSTVTSSDAASVVVQAPPTREGTTVQGASSTGTNAK